MPKKLANFVNATSGDKRRYDLMHTLVRFHNENGFDSLKYVEEMIPKSIAEKQKEIDNAKTSKERQQCELQMKALKEELNRVKSYVVWRLAIESV